MSGGVDSSVCASLMQKQGYECIGMTMRLWKGEAAKSKQSCCGSEAVDDARLVAERIGIPYYAINFEEEFYKEVIEVFAKQYFSGKTPSPCILCNEKLKFESLYKKALAIGAEKVCTGHYARIVFNETTGRWNLLKGVDTHKDQSYFLFSLTQEQLSKTLFPLGEYTKTEIREIAREDGLITANKPESQDICFITDGNYRKFIEKHFPNHPSKPGNIRSEDGTILGEHEGIHTVTVGQRKGLKIAFGKPLYVTGVDPEKQEVIVGEREKTYQSTFTVKRTNWIAEDAKVGQSYPLMIKIRARSPEAKGLVYPLPNRKAKVVFEKPQHAIAPGQAAVFYQGDQVFGGGWIE